MPRAARERDDGLRVGEEAVSGFGPGIGVPVVGFFGASDDGAAAEGAGDDEAP